MTPNTPNQPGDEVPHESADSGNNTAGVARAAGNTYNEQYERSNAAPDLDAAAPQLHANDMRRMNRRAIGFLAAIVILLIVLAFLLLRSATGQKQAPKPRSETLTVPQLPQLPQTPAPKPLPQPQPPAPPAAAATPVPVVPALPSSTPSVPALPQGPSLLQRREAASEGQAAAPPEVPAASAAGHGLLASKYGAPTGATPLTHPDTLLMQGTIIRCVLQTRIISDIPGFTSCFVTEPVYSFDGKELLLPKGSKVLGEYNSGPVGSRIAVIWNRIVTPNGIDVSMASPGIDNLGGSGLPGYLDSHWRQRISSALLISLMSDAFLYEGEKHGPKTNNIGSSGGFVVQSPYQSNTAQTLQNLANQAVQQSANRRPTLTINQGTVVSIYVARDVDFSGVVARL